MSKPNRTEIMIAPVTVVQLPKTGEQPSAASYDALARRIGVLIEHDVNITPESFLGSPVVEEIWQKARTEHPSESYLQGVRDFHSDYVPFQTGHPGRVE